jgi:hypothetical protein
MGIIPRMEFFFPEDNLTRAVPEETKIATLSAQPYPDGRRLRVNLEITPFQKRPYIEVIPPQRRMATKSPPPTSSNP